MRAAIMLFPPAAWMTIGSPFPWDYLGEPEEWNKHDIEHLAITDFFSDLFEVQHITPRRFSGEFVSVPHASI